MFFLRSILLVIVAGIITAGCAPRDARSSGSGIQVQDYTAEAYGWADSLVSDMTVDQRVGQLFMPALYASADPATLRLAAEYASQDHVGGVVLLKGDSEGATRIADTLASLAGGVPHWVSVDAETGLAMRLSDAPSMPVASELGKSADGQKMYELGVELARQSRARGINMILGPVLDVEKNPSGYIGRRSYGADPELVAELGVGFARGLEDSGVISVAKHFPGHGSADGDSHRGLPVIAEPLSFLQREALPPFEEYIGSGLSAVMVGHLAVSAIDPAMRSASLSGAVITDLLRGDLGFKGLVITDALNMDGATSSGSSGSTAVEALIAGADIILSPRDTRKEIEAVKSALAAGILTDSLIAARVRRVLFYKYRFLNP